MLLEILILIIISYFLILLYCKLSIGINTCSKHLVGKVVVVTGGNNGIGYETAKDMAQRGAKVIIGCRSEQRGTAARDKIVAETENNDVHFKKLDLASFKSVRAFADDILKNEKRLDILINNAGMHGTEKTQTEDGLLLDMQTNHFGPFLLTLLLIPLLKKSAPSRIVNVSSIAHYFAQLDFGNLNAEKKYFSSMIYQTTKLCNVLMTVELARRLKGTGVTTNALHPGVIDTDLLLNIPFSKLIRPLVGPFLKSKMEGAQTTIYLAVSPDVKNVSGKFFMDCREAYMDRKAKNEKNALKLWEISQKVVKFKEDYE